MAKKRKFVAYRKLERPYTRFSKFKNQSFVRARPVNRVVRYDMGKDRDRYTHRLKLLAKASIQIRDIAIESARLTTNRYLEKFVGKGMYKFKLLIYPHHVLRENPLAAGAGADRMSTGMKASFGKPIGVAAQFKKGKVLMRLDVDAANLEHGKIALKRAKYKIPCSCQIVIEEIKKTKKVAKVEENKEEVKTETKVEENKTEEKKEIKVEEKKVEEIKKEVTETKVEEKKEEVIKKEETVVA